MDYVFVIWDQENGLLWPQYFDTLESAQARVALEGLTAEMPIQRLRRAI